MLNYEEAFRERVRVPQDSCADEDQIYTKVV